MSYRLTVVATPHSCVEREYLVGVAETLVAATRMANDLETRWMRDSAPESGDDPVNVATVNEIRSEAVVVDFFAEDALTGQTFVLSVANQWRHCYRNKARSRL